MSTPSVTATSSRRGLMRWSIAAAATAALVVSGSGLVVFAQSGAGESQGPQFAPADALAYAEVRLDMPGGQSEALAQMMTAFPGFADPGSFDMKKDELFAMVTAQLGGGATDGELIGDVFTGEIGIALGDVDAVMMGGDPSLIAGLAVADADAAGAVMANMMAGAAESTTESSYNDVVIYTDAMSAQPMSLAMHDGWVLLGMGDGSVEAAIDVLDGNAPSLAEDEGFQAAWSRLPDARLAGAWMEFAPLTSMLDMAAMMAEGQVGMALPTQDLAGLLPVDMTAALVADTDRLTLEVIVLPGEMAPIQPMGDSDLAMSFPSDTQVYFETRELGAAVEAGLNGLAEVMAAQSEMSGESMGMEGMDDIAILFSEESPFTAMLGAPLPEVLDFVGDAGVGAALSSDGLWLGIAAEVNDPATGQERLTSLMTVLRMFLMQGAESGMDISTAEVGGVEVTTITLPIDEAMQGSGVPISVGDSIDVALADDRLLIGLGDFVESALLSDGSDSLGTSAGYVDALGDQVPNSGVTYVNVTSMLTALDPMISMMAPEWAEIQPFAAGLDRIMAVGIGDDDLDGVRIQVIVGQ